MSLQTSIPLNGCATICLHIHLLIEIWAVSSLELLQIKLLLDICIHFSE